MNQVALNQVVIARQISFQPFAARWSLRLLLCIVLPTAQCKPRDTSDYCQCEKICPRGDSNESCVATNDPRYGCASSTCDECNFPHATATCDNAGVCALGGCKPGYADCDGGEQNGCEVDYLNSVEHCGGCYQRCPGAETHADFVCNIGLCVVANCRDGYRDCNKFYADGCETDANTECEASTETPTRCN